MFVFDLETDRLLNKDRSNWDELRMTVGVGIDKDANRHDFVLKPDCDDHEHEAVLERLEKQLDSASVITIYNGVGFDLRILRNYFPIEKVKEWECKLIDPFDILRSGWRTWVKLDELLVANDLGSKSGDGVLAVKWWADGEYEKVLDYCYQDTLGLYKLMMKDGPIKFPIKRWKDGKQQIIKWHEHPGLKDLVIPKDVICD